MNLNYNLFIYIQRDLTFLYPVNYIWIIPQARSLSKKSDSRLKKEVVGKKFKNLKN